MNCETIHKMIPEYLAGALDSAEAEAVRLHLEDCESCRKEIQAHNKVWDMVGSLPEVTSPKGFTASVRERLQKSTPRSRPLHRPMVRATMAVAASLLLVFGLYFLITNFQSPVSPVEQPIAENEYKLAAAERDEIIKNLDILENFDSFSNENLKAEDIGYLKKEEFNTVEGLADRGVDPNFGATALAGVPEMDDK